MYTVQVPQKDEFRKRVQGLHNGLMQTFLCKLRNFAVFIEFGFVESYRILIKNFILDATQPTVCIQYSQIRFPSDSFFSPCSVEKLLVV